jgi:hypothetical protein
MTQWAGITYSSGPTNWKDKNPNFSNIHLMRKEMRNDRDRLICDSHGQGDDN